jgi:hypothetical protein
MDAWRSEVIVKKVKCGEGRGCVWLFGKTENDQDQKVGEFMERTPSYPVAVI